MALSFNSYSFMNIEETEESKNQTAEVIETPQVKKEATKEPITTVKKEAASHTKVDDANERLKAEIKRLELLKAEQEKQAKIKKEEARKVALQQEIKAQKKRQADIKKAKKEKEKLEQERYVENLKKLDKKLRAKATNVNDETTWAGIKSAFDDIVKVDKRYRYKITQKVRGDVAFSFVREANALLDKKTKAAAAAKSDKEMDRHVSKMPRDIAKTRKMLKESEYYASGSKQQKNLKSRIDRYEAWYKDALDQQKKSGRKITTVVVDNKDEENWYSLKNIGEKAANGASTSGQWLADGVKKTICLFSCDSFKKEEE